MKTINRVILVGCLCSGMQGCRLVDYLCNDLNFNPGGFGSATFWFC